MNQKFKKLISKFHFRIELDLKLQFLDLKIKFFKISFFFLESLNSREFRYLVLGCKCRRFQNLYCVEAFDRCNFQERCFPGAGRVHQDLQEFLWGRSVRDFQEPER